MPDVYSPDWYHALVDLRKRIGSPDFYSQLFDTVRLVVRCDLSGVFIYSGDRVDCMLLQETTDNYRKFIDLYMEGLYLLDPHYNMLAKGAETGLYHFQDIAPDCYHQTEFYQRFVKPAGITDEYDFIVKVDNLYYDFYINKLEGVFSEAESQILTTVAPILLDFMEEHCRYQDANPVSSLLPGQPYGSIFDSLGATLLTQREREVFQCILHGHSSKSTANKLNIALGTVKIHRRNIYNKLDISSQSELFSLCIQSLAIPEVSSAEDPLAALRESYTRPTA